MGIHVINKSQSSEEVKQEQKPNSHRASSKSLSDRDSMDARSIPDEEMRVQVKVILREFYQN